MADPKGQDLATVGRPVVSWLPSTARRHTGRAHRPSSVTALRERGRAPPVSREANGYRIAGFSARDAADIPRAFETVYGKDYLNPLVYDADRFAELVASGAQISFVARDAKGDFAGHLALTFPAPNRRLVEVSQGIVVPAHRQSRIFARLIERAIEFARDELGAGAVFGEALTNHTVSQRVLAGWGFRPVGLEMDFVPQRMLLHEHADGPAATLIQYLHLGHAHARSYLPPSHAEWFERLLGGAAIAGPSEVVTAAHAECQASDCEVHDLPRNDMTRVLVRQAGLDLQRSILAHQTDARAARRRSLQILVSLGDPHTAAAVEMLRAQGFACGGLLPGFFEDGAHAAIMYRSFEAPYFAGVALHDLDSKELFARVTADWHRVSGGASRFLRGPERDVKAVPMELLGTAAA